MVVVYETLVQKIFLLSPCEKLGMRFHAHSKKRCERMDVCGRKDSLPFLTRHEYCKRHRGYESDACGINR